MVTRKRKKNVKLRGGQTHGWGAKKKHRGKGNKGGSGMAGTGKRADAKKPSIWKEDYFGKKGFISKNTVTTKAMNVSELDQKIEKFEATKKATKQNGQYTIDLASIGIDKLLSKGKVTRKMNITVYQATQKAIEKVQQAGGQVNAQTTESAESTEEEQ